MSKHSTPLRLNESLVSDAKVMSSVYHRSTNEQIEYWAHIGQLVETTLSASDIALLLAEKAEVTVSVSGNRTATDAVEYEKSDEKFDPLTLMNTVAEDSQSGRVAAALKQRQHVLYEPAGEPGMLRAVYPNGETEVGIFKNGKFKKRKRVL